MKTEQISVFLENRTGRLCEVTNVLAEANINIRALSLADTSDFGILRMIVCDPQEAAKVLKKSGFAIGINHVVAVAVDDRPGGLDEIVQILNKAGINVEYMYAFMNKKEKSATMIFRFDKNDEAIDELQKKGIKILPPADVCGD